MSIVINLYNHQILRYATYLNFLALLASMTDKIPPNINLCIELVYFNGLIK